MTKPLRGKQVITTTEHFTPNQVIRAIRKGHGIAQVAADQLGCERRLIFHYQKQYPEVEAAYREEREKTVDFAENKQLQAMLKGERWAIENWLFCSKEGRERGWIKRAEQARDAGLLNAIQIVIPDNARGDALLTAGDDGNIIDEPPEVTIEMIERDLAHKRKIANLSVGRGSSETYGDSML